MKITNALALLLLLSTTANAIVLGFITGSDYVKMDRQSQYSWVYGAMDGIMAESVSANFDPLGPWLGQCISKHDFEQLKVIFEKELNGNPESWHAPAALVLQSSLNKFCSSK